MLLEVPDSHNTAPAPAGFSDFPLNKSYSTTCLLYIAFISFDKIICEKLKRIPNSMLSNFKTFL